MDDLIDETIDLQNLIKSLNILLKYGNVRYPTHCEHDVLSIIVNPSRVTIEDISELESLGFHPNYEDELFYSFAYGSA